MKKYKIHLLSLLFLVICISCKKNECSRCYYTVKGVNSENGEVVYEDSGEYLEEAEESGCEMSLEDYESKKEKELKLFVDYQNGLNPRVGFGLDFMSVKTWDEVYSYTIKCNQ